MARASERYLFAGLAVAVLGSALLVCPWLRGSDVYYLPKLCALAAASALVALGFALAKKRTGLGFFEVCVGLHLLMGSLSGALNGPVWSIPAAWLLPTLAAALLVAASARVSGARRQARDQLFDLVIVAFTLVALLAALESMGVPLPWESSRRPHSTLGNRNFVGSESVAVAVLAAYRLHARPSWWRLLGFVLLVCVVVLTRCRSAWLGALLVVPALVLLLGAERLRSLLLSPEQRRALWGVGGGLALGLGLALLGPWPGLQWNDSASMGATFARMTDYESGTGRERLADHAIGYELWRSDPWLGVGPRRWDDAASEVAHVVEGRHATARSFWATPNSDLVRITAEQGIFGLLTLAGAVATLLVSHLRRERSGDEDVAGQRAALLALLGLAVHGLFDAPLFRPSALVLVAVLAGVLRGAARPSSAAWPSLRYVPVLVAGLVLVGCGLRTAAALLIAKPDSTLADRRFAERLFSRPAVVETTALGLAGATRCREAEQDGARALLLSPHHFAVPYALGACFARIGELALARKYRTLALGIEPHAEELQSAGRRATARRVD